MASRCPEANEVDHFRSKVRQINLEATNFLQTFECRSYQDKPFINIAVFENVFSDFKATFDCSKLMQMFGQKVQHNFLFENWRVSHVSMEAASTILTFMGKNPEIFFTAACQLSKVPRVVVSNVVPQRFALLTSPKSLSDTSRTSKRTKLLTKKFQNSNFLNNGQLMASFMSVSNKSGNDDSNSENVLNIDKEDKTIIKKVKIRPKFRHLSNFCTNSNISLSLPPSWRFKQNLNSTEEFICSNAKRFKTCQTNFSNTLDRSVAIKPTENTINFDEHVEVRKYRIRLHGEFLVQFVLVILH